MRLLAVDSNSILNRAYFGVRPMTTHDGRPTNGVYGFLATLHHLLEEVQPDAVAFAFDLRGPTFRHRRYEGYKASRKGMPEELAAQLEPTKAAIAALGYRIVTCEGYEGDDVLGTLARMCREAGGECVLATGDRDSFQLIGGGVTVRLASTKNGQASAEMIDEAVIRERYGIEPRQLIDVKAIMGDTSDEIPGVKGIGEKGALQLIRSFGSLDGVYENLEDPSVRPAMRQKLIAARETAYLSRELAEICQTAPIGVALGDLIPAPRDNDALYRLLAGLELRRTIALYGVSEPAEAAGAAADAPQREPAAPVPVAVNDPAALERLLGEEALYACVAGDRDAPAALAVLGSSLALFTRAGGGLDEICDRLAEKNAALTLCNTKDWYHRAFLRGKAPALCAFDPALAGYLLAPTTSDYSPAALAAGRAIEAPCPALPDGLEESAAALAKEAVLLPALSEELRREVAEGEMTELLETIERPLSRVLASMEAAGFLLDTEGLRRYGEELEGDLAEVTQRITLLAGGKFNFNSPKQLGEVLFERLGLPAGRKTRTGYSTDAETLEKLRGRHPIIEEILEYRKLAKLKSTYVDSMLEKADENGLVHTVFKQTETRTGRISSAEPNLQNIPVRTERGSRLRAFFAARPGHVLVDADYSQIELRVLAHLAGDEAMINAFLSGADIHTQTAAQVFDLPQDFVTPQMRSAAKAVNFGLVYGIGAYSLSEDIGVTIEEAKRYIEAYFATYPGIAAYMEKTVEQAKQAGCVTTMFHRRRALPELRASRYATRAFGERVARNTPIQGTAADIIKLAMVNVYDRLEKEGLRARLILQVHDELIVEAPEAEAARAAAIVTEEMQNAVSLRVPLTAEAGMGRNWLEAKG